MTPDQRYRHTPLAELRAARRVSQTELAEVTGLSVRTIQRVESDHYGPGGPPIRYLVQCAIALDVDLDALIDPAWTEWQIFAAAAPEPPPERWWDRVDTPRWNKARYPRRVSRGE